jgi:hypothetical protein
MVNELLSDDNAIIFEIAKNLETSFFTPSKKGKLYETDNISSNMHFSKMRKKIAVVKLLTATKIFILL